MRLRSLFALGVGVVIPPTLFTAVLTLAVRDRLRRNSFPPAKVPQPPWRMVARLKRGRASPRRGLGAIRGDRVTTRMVCKSAVPATTGNGVVRASIAPRGIRISGERWVRSYQSSGGRSKGAPARS